MAGTNDDDDESRLRGRSIRVDDALWHRAQAAAEWRDKGNLSAVIRQCLASYVRDTERRQRNDGRQR